MTDKTELEQLRKNAIDTAEAAYKVTAAFNAAWDDSAKALDALEDYLKEHGNE